MIDGRWVQICWVHRASPRAMSLWGHVMTVQSSRSSPPDPWAEQTEEIQNKCNSVEWMTDRGWSYWVTPYTHDRLQNKCTPLLLSMKHSIRHISPAKRPHSWATILSVQYYYLQVHDAPSCVQLKADHHCGGQWSNHPRPHGRALAGCKPALGDRLAFHP